MASRDGHKAVNALDSNKTFLTLWVLMKRFFSIAAGLMLASCAYALEGSLQEVTFETLGAENAICYLHEPGFKRTIRPPQTVTVNKSHKTLQLDCSAPGNREQTVYIEPETIDAIALNIGTGLIPGLITDYGTGAMFLYPDLVQVDFTGMRPKPNSLPKYHARDTLPPMKKGLEEFRPGHPELSTDIVVPNAALFKRGEEADENAEGTGEQSAEASAEENTEAPATTADELTEQYNPWVFDSPAGNSQLYYDPPSKQTTFPVTPLSESDSFEPVQLYPLD